MSAERPMRVKLADLCDNLMQVARAGGEPEIAGDISPAGPSSRLSIRSRPPVPAGRPRLPQNSEQSDFGFVVLSGFPGRMSWSLKPSDRRFQH